MIAPSLIEKPTFRLSSKILLLIILIIWQQPTGIRSIVSHKYIHKNGIREFTVHKQIKGNDCLCNCLCMPRYSSSSNGVSTEWQLLSSKIQSPYKSSQNTKSFKIIKEISGNKCHCQCACSSASKLSDFSEDEKQTIVTIDSENVKGDSSMTKSAMSPISSTISIEIHNEANSAIANTYEGTMSMDINDMTTSSQPSNSPSSNYSESGLPNEVIITTTPIAKTGAMQITTIVQPITYPTKGFAHPITSLLNSTESVGHGNVEAITLQKTLGTTIANPMQLLTATEAISTSSEHISTTVEYPSSEQLETTFQTSGASSTIFQFSDESDNNSTITSNKINVLVAINSTLNLNTSALTTTIYSQPSTPSIQNAGMLVLNDSSLNLEVSTLSVPRIPTEDIRDSALKAKLGNLLNRLKEQLFTLRKLSEAQKQKGTTRRVEQKMIDNRFTQLRDRSDNDEIYKNFSKISQNLPGFATETFDYMGLSSTPDIGDSFNDSNGLQQIGNSTAAYTFAPEINSIQTTNNTALLGSNDLVLEDKTELDPIFKVKVANLMNRLKEQLFLLRRSSAAMPPRNNTPAEPDIVDKPGIGIPTNTDYIHLTARSDKNEKNDDSRKDEDKLVFELLGSSTEKQNTKNYATETSQQKSAKQSLDNLKMELDEPNMHNPIEMEKILYMLNKSQERSNVNFNKDSEVANATRNLNPHSNNTNTQISVTATKAMDQTTIKAMPTVKVRFKVTNTAIEEYDNAWSMIAFVTEALPSVTETDSESSIYKEIAENTTANNDKLTMKVEVETTHNVQKPLDMKRVNLISTSTNSNENKVIELKKEDSQIIKVNITTADLIEVEIASQNRSLVKESAKLVDSDFLVEVPSAETMKGQKVGNSSGSLKNMSANRVILLPPPGRNVFLGYNQPPTTTIKPPHLKKPSTASKTELVTPTAAISEWTNESTSVTLSESELDQRAMERTDNGVLDSEAGGNTSSSIFNKFSGSKRRIKLIKQLREEQRRLDLLASVYFDQLNNDQQKMVSKQRRVTHRKLARLMGVEPFRKMANKFVENGVETLIPTSDGQQQEDLGRKLRDDHCALIMRFLKKYDILEHQAQAWIRTNCEAVRISHFPRASCEQITGLFAICIRR